MNWRAWYYQTYDMELIRIEKDKKPSSLISWEPSPELIEVRTGLLEILKKGKKAGSSDYVYLEEETVRELIEKAQKFGCKVSPC